MKLSIVINVILVVLTTSMVFGTSVSTKQTFYISDSDGTSFEELGQIFQDLFFGNNTSLSVLKSSDKDTSISNILLKVGAGREERIFVGSVSTGHRDSLLRIKSISIKEMSKIFDASDKEGRQNPDIEMYLVSKTHASFVCVKEVKPPQYTFIEEENSDTDNSLVTEAGPYYLNE